MHEAALIHINNIAVTAVVDEMAPSNTVRLARQGEIIIPSITLGVVQLVNMSAAAASASIYKGIVIDRFITEFAKAMTTCCMLHYTTGIKRIVIGAERTEGYRRAVCPHLRYASIVSGVRNNNDECLAEVAFRHGRCSQSIREYLVVFCFQSSSTRERRAEAVIADGVHRGDTRLG